MRSDSSSYHIGPKKQPKFPEGQLYSLEAIPGGSFLGSNFPGDNIPGAFFPGPFFLEPSI